MQEKITVDFDDTLGQDSTSGSIQQRISEALHDGRMSHMTREALNDWEKQQGGIVADGRVSNLHSANYRQGSDLVFFDYGCTQPGRTNSSFSK